MREQREWATLISAAGSHLSLGKLIDLALQGRLHRYCSPDVSRRSSSRVVPTPLPSIKINGVAADEDAWRNLKGRNKQEGYIIILVLLLFYMKH